MGPKESVGLLSFLTSKTHQESSSPAEHILYGQRTEDLQACSKQRYNSRWAVSFSEQSYHSTWYLSLTKKQGTGVRTTDH